jgi:hypothetical protein
MRRELLESGLDPQNGTDGDQITCIDGCRSASVLLEAVHAHTNLDVSVRRQRDEIGRRDAALHLSYGKTEYACRSLASQQQSSWTRSARRVALDFHSPTVGMNT